MGEQYGFVSQFDLVCDLLGVIGYTNFQGSIRPAFSAPTLVALEFFLPLERCAVAKGSATCFTEMIGVLIMKILFDERALDVRYFSCLCLRPISLLSVLWAKQSSVSRKNCPPCFCLCKSRAVFLKEWHR